MARELREATGERGVDNFMMQRAGFKLHESIGGNHILMHVAHAAGVLLTRETTVRPQLNNPDELSARELRLADKIIDEMVLESMGVTHDLPRYTEVLTTPDIASYVGHQAVEREVALAGAAQS